MFSVILGIFNIEKAAKLVAEGLTMEENKQWHVGFKMVYFKTIRIDDVKEATMEGWIIRKMKGGE